MKLVIEFVNSLVLLVVAWLRSYTAKPTPELESSVEPAPEPEPEPIPEPPKPEPLAIPAPRRGKFVKPRNRPPPIPRPEPQSPRPKAEPKPKPVTKVTDEDPEAFGQYYFRDTILDQLDKYFVYLRRMKARDPDAYEMCRTVGAHVVPLPTIEMVATHPEEACKRRDTPLSPWWQSHRPGFGAVVFGANSQEEAREKKWTDILKDKEVEFTSDIDPERLERNKIAPDETIVLRRRHKHEKGWAQWTPKFMYFCKYARNRAPPTVQKVSGGDIYVATVYFDKPYEKQMKAGVPQDFAVFISDDGTRVRVLKILEQKMNVVRGKRGQNRGREIRIPQKDWKFPDEFTTWARTNGMDAEAFLRHMFIDSVSRLYEASQSSMIRVAASKDNMTAVFGVDIKRTAYFFQDREVTLTQSGRTERIFHIVRPHERHTRNGVRPVRMHFRGLRRFEWAGHEIEITVPGRDHFMESSWDIGSLDSFWISKGGKKKYLDSRRTAQTIVDSMKKGLGGLYKKRPPTQGSGASQGRKAAP